MLPANVSLDEFHVRMAFQDAAEAEAVRGAPDPQRVLVKHAWKGMSPYYYNPSTEERWPADSVPKLETITAYARAPGKPACRYGAKCTRNNPLHFAEEDHPFSHPKIVIADHLKDYLPTRPEPAAPPAPVPVTDRTNMPPAAATGKKRKGVADAAADADARAAKKQAIAAKQQAKADEKEARELRKIIGDGIKAALRPYAEPGELKISGVRPAVMRLVFHDAGEVAPSVGVNPACQLRRRLSKQDLVAIFGTTKIEKGGSRDHRYDCDHAFVQYDDDGTLRVKYHPKHMGSNVWWRN